MIWVNHRTDVDVIQPFSLFLRTMSTATAIGSKIKIIILSSDVHAIDRFFFLAESHLFAFNTLRTVNSPEEPPIIYCIAHLSLMMLYLELLPYRTLFYSVYRCTKSLLISFCGSHFIRSKKETFQNLIGTDSHECATTI